MVVPFLEELFFCLSSSVVEGSTAFNTTTALERKQAFSFHNRTLWAGETCVHTASSSN